MAHDSDTDVSVRRRVKAIYLMGIDIFSGL